MKESSRSGMKVVGIIFLIVLLTLLLVKVLRQGIYSSRLGMNIAVFGSKGAGLLLIRPEEETVGWVTFPNNLMVKIYNSEAKYPLISLWEYGLLEKNPYEIVEKSIGLSMGVTVARTIKVNGEVSIEGVISHLHRLDMKTNFSPRDRLLLRKFLTETVASKKVLEMDIPQKIFDKTTDPDGKEFVSFNSVATLWTKNKFVLESILTENVDLVVNNISGQSGLGAQVARQLESAGMRVIEVKSDPESAVEGKGCHFMVMGNYPYTESLLVDQMNCVEIRVPEITKSDQREKGITVWIK